MEPRIDGNATANWPTPKMIEAVGGKVRIVNCTSEPQFICKNNHFCQLYLTTNIDTSTITDTRINLITMKTVKEGPSTFHSDAVNLDPDRILQESDRKKFQDLLAVHDSVFNPRFGGYNGAAGKFEASINMRPVLPPQRKGRLPQYSRDKIEILEQKCDELKEL